MIGPVRSFHGPHLGDGAPALIADVGLLPIPLCEPIGPLLLPELIRPLARDAFPMQEVAGSGGCHCLVVERCRLSHPALDPGKLCSNQ